MTMRHVFTTMLLATGIAMLGPTSAEQPAPAPAPSPSAVATGQRPVVRMGTKQEEFLMTKIAVSDLVRSYEFYTQVIGLKLVTSPDIPTAKAPTPNDPEKDFIEIPLNYSGSMADPLFVLFKRRGQKPSLESTGVVMLGFKVPDTIASVQRAVQAGYKAPRGLPAAGLPGFVADPDGYTIEFISAASFANP